MSQENKSSGLFTGIAVGTIIGAGMAYLFGTKKGAQIRKQIRSKYPAFFDQADDVVEDVKENLSEKYDDANAEVQKLKKSAPKLIKKIKSKI